MSKTILPLRVKDVTGRRFGKLTAVRFAGMTHGRCGRPYATWECSCDCGGTTVLRIAHLTSGKTSSCGCLQASVLRTHGMSGVPEHKVWEGIFQRCHNPNSRFFAYYGGRGITVSDDWRRFENFLVDMGRRPTPLHTLDRIDPNGNYCWENCRWATRREQQRNTRHNRLITFNGVTMLACDWDKAAGRKQGTITSRISGGYPISRILQAAFDSM